MDLDSRTRALLRTVYPDLAVRIVRTLEDMKNLHGRTMRACEAMRTMDYQAKLYAQGRTAPGDIVTNSPPGSSMHNFGLAVDCCFEPADPWLEKMGKPSLAAKEAANHLWSEYGRLGQAHGLEWGGAWHSITDRPHLQLVFGLSTAQVRELYRAGGIAGVWARCDQLRKVPVGQEWNSPTTKKRVLDAGILP